MFKDYVMFRDYVDDVLKERGFKLINTEHDGLRYYKICDNTHNIPYSEAVEIWIGSKDVVVRGIANADSPVMFRRHYRPYYTDKPSLYTIEETALEAIKRAIEFQ